MDLTDELEQTDSGMESLIASKDDTPERRPDDSFTPPEPSPAEPNLLVSEQESANNYEVATYAGGGAATQGSLKEYDDEPDETLYERLWGLTEMFPEPVRNGTHIITTKAWSGMKGLYGVSRSVMWIIASSSVILFAPVIFEVERAQVDEMQKSQQKQVLLGTNAALSSTPPMPPMPR